MDFSAFGSLLDAASNGPESFICWLLCAPLYGLLANMLGPLLEQAFQWGTDYTAIPYVGQIIAYLQGAAVLGVIILRVAAGIRSGLLRGGGSYEFSFGEYVYKTLIALVLVAAMPTLCKWVISFGKLLFDYIYSATGGISSATAFFSMDGINVTDMSSAGFAFLFMLLGVLAIVVMAIRCAYQFIKRQIEMLVVSLIAPIVAVYAATEDDAGQVFDLLKQLFGLVCQQWIQYVLVMVAIGVGQAWVAAGSTFAGSAGGLFLATIAMFGAAGQIPQLVDRYTFGGRGGRGMGAYLAAQTSMMGVRSLVARAAKK